MQYRKDLTKTTRIIGSRIKQEKQQTLISLNVFSKTTCVYIKYYKTDDLSFFVTYPVFVINNQYGHR